MVKSRYLCSAPRPETWDERAEALLKSLGGSAEKRETLIRETLDALKVMHADKQKTGPGRKSNAEHAIAFYEYVLETIIEAKEGANDEAEDPPVAPVAQVPVKRKRGRPPKNRSPVAVAEPEKADATNTTATKTTTKETTSRAALGAAAPASSPDDQSVATMDTQEFINEHNDFCEVCSQGGELLMCSTCNLVFHMHCVRPKMEEAPPDSWVCAYCIMSGVKGLRQNSKMRKNAAVAVRLMARMRKSLARQRNKRNLEAKDAGKGDDDDDDDDDHVDEDDEEEVNNDSTNNASGSDDKMSDGAAISDGNESSDSVNVKTEGTATSSDDDDKQQLAATEVRNHNDEEESTEQVSREDDMKVASSPGRKRSSRTTRTSLSGPDDGNASTGDDAGDNSNDGDKNITGIKTESPEASAGGKAGDVKVVKTESGGDGTPKRRNSRDNANPTPSDDTESPGRRVRRVRKQATYYDPQNGPASKWESDGANEWKRVSGSVEDDDEVDDGSEDEESDHTATKSEANEAGREAKKPEGGEPMPLSKKGLKKAGDKGPWCKFCLDNKDIPVCCFCACRVCFGKHEQSKLLLCDKCDDEYHTFCLNPPLKSVPSSQSWFCPNCVKAERQASARLAARTSKITPEKAAATTLETRSSGKKSKSASPKSKRAHATKSAEKVSTPTESPPKRGPGRPRKDKDPPEKKENTRPTVVTEPPKKRGPGRPRKHPLPEPTVAVEPPPRKRGRPPKDRTLEASVSPPQPRKRGRPRKNPSPEEPPLKKKRPSPSPDQEEPKRRGPGRPPKKAKGPGRPPKKNSDRNHSRSPAPKKPKQENESLEAKPKSKPKATKAKDNATVTPVPTPKPPPPVKVSRSGRAVKRTSFHDEIDEGEQHLKSSRYAEMQRKAETEAAADATSEGYLEVTNRLLEEGNTHVEEEEREGEQDVVELVEQPTVALNGVHQSVDNIFYGGGVEHQHLEHDVDPHFLDSMPDVADMQQHLGVTLDDNFGSNHDAAVSQPLLMMEPMHMQIEVSKKKQEPTQVAPVCDVIKEAHLPDERKPAPVSESLPAAEPTANLASHSAAPVKKVAAATPAPAPSAPAPVPDPPTTQRPSQQDLVAVRTAPKAPPATVTSSIAAPAPGPDLNSPSLKLAAATSAPAPSAEVFEQLPTAAPVPSAESDQMPAAIEVAAAPVPAQPAVSQPIVASAVATTNDPSQASYNSASVSDSKQGQPAKVPRRKPGARECMQISRRFGVNVIPEKSMDTLLDYCNRGKVEHLIRMRERLDEHSRFLESQLSGLEALVAERGESDVVVPAMPEAENEGGE